MAEATFVPSSPAYPISSLNRGREESCVSTQCDFPSRDSEQVMSGSREGRTRQGCMDRLQNQVRLSCWDRGNLFWHNFTLFYCFTSSQLAPRREFIMTKYIEYCKYMEQIVNYLLGITTDVLQGWVF